MEKPKYQQCKSRIEQHQSREVGLAVLARSIDPPLHYIHRVFHCLSFLEFVYGKEQSMSIIGAVSIKATDVGAFTNTLDHLMALADRATDHGGRYLAKGGNIESIKGEPPPDRLLVLEFEHVGQARAWIQSSEFSELAELASTCSRMQTVIVEGV